MTFKWRNKKRGSVVVTYVLLQDLISSDLGMIIRAKQIEHFIFVGDKYARFFSRKNRKGILRIWEFWIDIFGTGKFRAPVGGSKIISPPTDMDGNPPTKGILHQIWYLSTYPLSGRQSGFVNITK